MTAMRPNAVHMYLRRRQLSMLASHLWTDRYLQRLVRKLVMWRMVAPEHRRLCKQVAETPRAVGIPGVAQHIAWPKDRREVLVLQVDEPAIFSSTLTVSV